MPLNANSQSSVEGSVDGESDDDEFCELQYVFLMVLDEHRKSLLMFQQQDEWYLPFFEYAYPSGRHKARASRQLQKKLGMPMDRQYLIPTYDAFGEMYTDSMNGKETLAYSNLLIVDLSLTSFKPKLPAAWHDIDSVSRIAEKTRRCRGPCDLVHESIFETTLKVLRGDYPRLYQNDIRYRQGWFQKASQYFISTMADLALPTAEPVFEYSHSETSTVLALDTEQGRYYLKSPAAGCDEVKVTKALFQHFPEQMPLVVGTNDELNCFISQSLEILENLDPGAVKDPAVAEIVVSTLARMQLQSRGCLALLETSGVQKRSPVAIAEQLHRWVREDSFTMKNFPAGMRDFSKNIEMLEEALGILQESGIPLTLVHGDVSESNLGRRKGGEGEDVWVLYDWQYACISHPFFDLHCVYEDLSPKALEQYLRHWTDFGTMEELKQVLPIACGMAWLLKAWTLIECVEACCPAESSSVIQFFFDCLARAKSLWQNLQSLT